MFKSFFGKSKTTKVVKTKSGSSTYSKVKNLMVKQNGLKQVEQVVLAKKVNQNNS